MVTLPELDVTGLTISAIRGNTVTLSGSSGTEGEWTGGLLRITNGTYEQMSVAIIHNDGTELTIGTPFDPATAQELVGSTCELQGGPLRDATVFHIQPKSIKNIIDEGGATFIYINPLDMAIGKRALGGNNSPQHAARNQARSFTLQIIGSVPFLSGGATAAEAYTSQTAVYDLAEQITSRLMMFSSLTRFPLASEFEISCNFGLLEPDDGPKSEIIIMEFPFSVAL